MTRMVKGANVPAPAEPLQIAVCRAKAPGAPVVDVSALLVAADGRVRGDADLVFGNQPHHPSGAARHLGRAPDDGGPLVADWLWLDLAGIEPGVDRVVVAASADGGPFGRVPGLDIRVTTMTGAPVAYFGVDDATTETAFVLGEFYRHRGGWKFRAVGQGWTTGLHGLATDFGVEVADTDPSPDSAPAAHGPAVDGAGGTRDGAGFGPDFVPFVRKGNAHKTFAVPRTVPAGPALLQVELEDDAGRVQVKLLGASGDRGEELWRGDRNRIRARFLVQVPEDRPLRLGIRASRWWTVKLMPVSHAEPFTGHAHGHDLDVLRYDGPADDLHYRVDATDGADAAFGLGAVFPGEDPMTPRPAPAPEAAGGTATGVVRLPGPALLQVRGRAFWSLNAASGPPVLAEYGSGRRAGAPVEIVNPLPGSPVILEYHLAEGPTSRFYEATETDEYEQERALLFAHRDGMRGRVLLFTDGRAATRVRIRSVARWALRLLPLESARPLVEGVRGKGTDVLAHRGGASVVTLTGSAGRAPYYRVEAGAADAIAPAPVLEAAGSRPARGPVPGEPGVPAYVTVRCGGMGWTLGLTGADGPRRFAESVEGHGYEVVHYTGRPGEARVECGEDGPVELWLLDKHFAPDRRIAAGPGRHEIQPGPVQVRGLGRWRITVGG
ncbi:TerD family protein [Streptomyces pristinaespiralis]|uniref:TerD family protein n=1 Tax=Streptomyces pristinaespiralis TaxID=38300 RepID=UPI003832D1C2